MDSTMTDVSSLIDEKSNNGASVSLLVAVVELDAACTWQLATGAWPHSGRELLPTGITGNPTSQ